MALRIVMLYVSLLLVAVAADDDLSLRQKILSVSTVKCKGDGCPTAKQEENAFRPTSCLDYLLKGASKCGMYQLYDDSGNSYPAYCDMKTEPGTAWTLVMSWSTQNRNLPAFMNIPFKFNSPVNENAQNWNLYRLSLTRMKSLQAHSTHWRSTCSYPKYGVDFTDYVRGNFKDFNIVDFIGANQCKKVEYVNIRGHMAMHATVRFWQDLNKWLLHTDSSSVYKTCQFNAAAGSVREEDNFGHHQTINPKFRCTEGSDSTTQWWFGAHM